ncbi:MAG: BsaA family SipW-dependent biofilm matrix protein [Lachnospiraceae bacterium]|jgi:predicted ribosomally synthesized peptide with SipW-like signal peptide|nr:BsaA family SipW-dependent biofilm matrix protein [Lachnospiraceae bacterium]
MRNNKKLAVGISAVLAFVLIVSATYAWFTANDSVRNRLESTLITDGSTRIVEVFTPPSDWKPGQEVTKEVSVANDGSGPILVRASFEEIMRQLKLPVKDFTAAASGSQVPQLFNAAAYLSWADLAGLTPVGLPSDVKVKMKKVTDAQGRDTYSFVPLCEIKTGTYTGKYQRITADFKIDGTNLNVSNVKYWAYEGFVDSESAWADFANPTTGAAPTPRQPAEIDHPATDAGKKITFVYADKTNIIAAAPVAGKWWYNKTDGFFYYIGKLDSGTMSPELLSKLKLAQDAGEAYSGMSFDLIVNLEAIQNTEAAITDASGWNLAGNTTLINALKPFLQ